MVCVHMQDTGHRGICATMHQLGACCVWEGMNVKGDACFWNDPTASMWRSLHSQFGLPEVDGCHSLSVNDWASATYGFLRFRG